MAKIKRIQFSDHSFCCSFAPCLIFVPQLTAGTGQGLKKLILFSDVEKGKGKSFHEGKKLILFSDVEKGKGKLFLRGKS